MDAILQTTYENRILNGDCTKLLRTLPTQAIDLVLTDPPYFVRYRDRDGRTVANDDNPDSVLGAFTELYRVLKPNTFCVSFYGWNSIDAFMRAWRHAGFQPIGHIVWRKDYVSSTSFLRARHEQAYLLAKGRPGRPDKPIDDLRDGNTAATFDIQRRRTPRFWSWMAFSLSRRAHAQRCGPALSRHKRPPPRADAGPLHLFHDRRTAPLIAARAVMDRTRAIPPENSETVMSFKSQRGIVRHLCMVCCVECTGESLIIDLGVRSATEKRAAIGWGLCPQCQRLADEGYIALVECNREKSGSPLDGELVHASQVYRTGRVARVKRSVFCALFKVPTTPPIPCVFVEPGLLEKVEAFGHQTLH